MKHIDRAIQLLRRTAWPIAFICAGMFLGLMLKYPVAWPLGESRAVLIGSALGAVAAIAGAAIVWRMQVAAEEARAEKALRARRIEVAHALLAPLSQWQHDVTIDRDVVPLCNDSSN